MEVWWGNGLLSVPCFFGTILLNPSVAPVLSQQHLGSLHPVALAGKQGWRKGTLIYLLHPHLPSFALALDEALKKLRKIFFCSKFFGKHFNYLFLMLSKRILSKQSCRIALLPQPVLLNYLVRVVLVAEDV